MLLQNKFNYSVKQRKFKLPAVFRAFWSWKRYYFMSCVGLECTSKLESKTRLEKMCVVMSAVFFSSLW